MTTIVLRHDNGVSLLRTHSNDLIDLMQKIAEDIAIEPETHKFSLVDDKFTYYGADDDLLELTIAFNTGILTLATDYSNKVVEIDWSTDTL